ncbi:MAG: caspase family protein, partial [Pirellulales bacterium]
MWKHRKWQTFLTVSASGPEFSDLLDARRITVRPRAAADLRFTTADVDYLENHFQEKGYDSGLKESHVRHRNPSIDKVHSALEAHGTWLSQFNRDAEWDGGSFQLCYAGHGREGDGALVLQDGTLTACDLVRRLREIAERVSAPRALRVSVILDSCHSGAFAIEVLDHCFRSGCLVPWMVFASCMHDEVAWEETS